MWLRGMLQDDHGVDQRGVTWVAGPMDAPAKGMKESHPANVTCHYAKPGVSLSDMALAGEIDAVFAHRPPAIFRTGKLRRLYEDVGAAERDYFKTTGVIPLLHVAAVQTRFTDKDKALAGALQNALTQAKTTALDALDQTAVYAISLPSLARAVEGARALVGNDYWPYGLDANRAAIETFLRYSHEQGLTETRLSTSDVFPHFA